MKSEFEYLNDVKMDFSIYESDVLTEKEKRKMKKIADRKTSLKKYVSVGVCAATVVALGITAYASGFIDNVIKFVSTGYNEFVLIDTTNMTKSVPEEFKGLLFDENGNEINEFVGADMKLYDENGDLIDDIGKYLNEKGISEFVADNERIEIKPNNAKDDPLANAREMGYPVIDDINEIDGYLAFEAKLPEYLPEGFEFYGASAYGTDYLFVYYMNGANEYIAVHERIINEETAFSASVSKSIDEIMINGKKAVLLDGRSIDWETDGISVGVNGRDVISKDELIKMAESIK